MAGHGGEEDAAEDDFLDERGGGDGGEEQPALEPERGGGIDKAAEYRLGLQREAGVGEQGVRDHRGGGDHRHRGQVEHDGLSQAGAGRGGGAAEAFRERGSAAVLEVQHQSEREGLCGDILQDNQCTRGIGREGLDRGLQDLSDQRERGEEYRHHQGQPEGVAPVPVTREQPVGVLRSRYAAAAPLAQQPYVKHQSRAKDHEDGESGDCRAGRDFLGRSRGEGCVHQALPLYFSFST